MEKPRVGEPNFRCILIQPGVRRTGRGRAILGRPTEAWIQPNACRGNNTVEYQLLVIYNHALADGTSGMILTSEILTLYDQALENSNVLGIEIAAEIEKPWEEKIKPYILDGTQNYEVIDLGLFEVKKAKNIEL